MPHEKLVDGRDKPGHDDKGVWHDKRGSGDMSGVAWTLAVAQMDCATGDTEANLATIARFASEAAVQQVDLAVFPECATTGYFLGDLGAELIVNSTNWIADAYQQETWGWSGPVTQGLAATRALENGTFVAMANRVGEEELAPGLSFTSLGHSCIAGPSGKILAALTDGEGLAVARIDIAQEDLDRWRAIATYRADRRPELTS